MIMSYNWGKKALCFFVFAVLCALSAYAESCSSAGNLRYSASGCSYTTEICCRGAWTSGTTCTECVKETCSSNYYWSSGKCACVACGIPPNNGAPFQYNSTTTPTAEQYKANALMCQFKVLCLDESGWRTDPGTGLDLCVCKNGYTWDRSSQTCKKNASTSKPVCSTNVSRTVAGSSQAEAISLCKSGPYANERTGRLGAGQTEGGMPTCPGSKGTFTLSCSAELNSNNKWQYVYNSTVCLCQTN